MKSETGRRKSQTKLQPQPQTVVYCSGNSKVVQTGTTKTCPQNRVRAITFRSGHHHPHPHGVDYAMPSLASGPPAESTCRPSQARRREPSLPSQPLAATCSARPRYYSYSNHPEPVASLSPAHRLPRGPRKVSLPPPSAGVSYRARARACPARPGSPAQLRKLWPGRTGRGRDAMRARFRLVFGQQPGGRHAAGAGCGNIRAIIREGSRLGRGVRRDRHANPKPQ
jgi:hypothetical protein